MTTILSQHRVHVVQAIDGGADLRLTHGARCLGIRDFMPSAKAKDGSACSVVTMRVEIVAFCDKLFAEPFATLTDAQRAAVAAWCPPMMQTAGLACDEAEPAADSREPDSEVAQAA